eukprot:TRINITY_DN78652_c0_g1_i1.p1 TRINITY_DN78652_c0_g1~~TRINITY_DN78652_c0_g1_i1.p1  ORF type:complete len:444 (+),score=68.07 TRINITY_DN78652_c0_g1_i1:41-1372(+)
MALDKVGTQQEFSFTYANALNAGELITETLQVNRQAGRCLWSRGQDTGCWLTSDVTSVRFSTRKGDPSMEFLSAGHKRLVQGRAFEGWLRRHSPVVLALLSILCNALSMTVLFLSLLVHFLMEVFPVRSQADDVWQFEMTQGPNSNALGAAAVTAFLALLSALVAGWWLGSFRCRCCGMSGFSQDSILAARRLSEESAARWAFFRPLGGGCLALIVAWCIFVIVLCPIAYGLSFKNECHSGSCQAARALTKLPAVCGVAGCSCGTVSDLMCKESNAENDQWCRNVKLPLCQAQGDTGTTSGVLGPLLVALCGATGLLVILSIVWLMNAYCMAAVVLAKPPESPESPDSADTGTGTELYHKFTVSLRSAHGDRANSGQIIFTLGAEEDPQAVFDAVMPLDGGVSPAGHLLPFVHPGFEMDASSTGVPTVLDAEGEGAEPDQPWY